MHVAIKIFLLLTATLFFSSCVSYETLFSTKIARVDGRKQVHNSHTQVLISYYGDYDFHKPKKKLFPAINRKHLKSCIKDDNVSVVYSAHTSIEPIGSTLGLYYPQISIEEITSEVSQFLKNDLRVLNLSNSSETIGVNNFTILKYDIGDLEYIEYFNSSDDNTLRVVFWTNNPREEWLSNETKGIVQTFDRNQATILE